MVVVVGNSWAEDTWENLAEDSIQALVGTVRDFASEEGFVFDIGGDLENE